jgi:hypothetical protein
VRAGSWSLVAGLHGRGLVPKVVEPFEVPAAERQRLPVEAARQRVHLLVADTDARVELDLSVRRSGGDEPDYVVTPRPVHDRDRANP